MAVTGVAATTDAECVLVDGRHFADEVTGATNRQQHLGTVMADSEHLGHTVVDEQHPGGRLILFEQLLSTGVLTGFPGRLE
jgi:hypothetical protein